MVPDQVRDIGGGPDIGGVSDSVERVNHVLELLHDRCYAWSINAFFGKEFLISKSELSQELVYVCQLTVMFIEHRRNVHHLPGDDELGDDVDRYTQPVGKSFEIA